MAPKKVTLAKTKPATKVKRIGLTAVRTRAKAAKAKSLTPGAVTLEDTAEKQDHVTADLSTPLSHNKTVNTSDTSMRVDLLEKDVANIRTDVTSLHQKMDLLIDSSLSREAPKTHSTPKALPPTQKRSTDDDHTKPSSPRKRNQLTILDDTLEFPSTKNLQQAPGAGDFIARELQKEKYQVQHTDGKALFLNNPFQKAIHAKPYMYLERSACHTLKQKLDARHTMSSLEYIGALTRLIRKDKTYPREQLPFMLDHLTDITKDASQRKWEGVLTWSQSVFDSIENDDFGWKDWDRIQNARHMMSFCPPPNAPHSTGTTARTPHSSATQSASGVQLGDICSDFNTQQGCRNSNPHAKHCCLYCYTTGKLCAHSIVRCDRKLRDAGYSAQAQQQQRPHGFTQNHVYNNHNNNNNGGQRHTSDHYPPQNYAQYSKNS